jgi:methyl-accepting chemotaxis protein
MSATSGLDNVNAGLRRRRRLPIGYKMILGIGGLLTLLVAATLTAIVVVVGVGHAAQTDGYNAPYSNAVDAAALAAKGIANDERGFLLSGQDTFVAEAGARTAAARTAFAAAAAAARTGAERAAVQDAHAGFETWVATVRHGFTEFQAGHRTAAVAASVGPNRLVRKTYETSLAHAQKAARAAQASAETSFARQSNRSIVILLIGLGLALAIAVPLAFWLVRSVAMPVFRIVSLLYGDSLGADLGST